MSFNNRAILRILSVITLTIGLAMVIPMLAALAYSEKQAFESFITISLVLVLIGATGMVIIKPKGGHLRIRDGYFIVSICWLVAACFGALPYMVTGVTASVTDALFVSISAFTTTGATVLKLDMIPKSVLLWQGVCNWLGGMGILVLIISIIPAMGIEGRTMMEAEVTGVSSEKVSNRLSDSSKELYLLYIVFTVIELLLLFIGPMDFFDALLNTLSSVSTSGMPSMHHALTHYNSLYVEFIISSFTFLTSISFTVYYFLLQRDFKAVFGNQELRGFLIMILTACVLVAGNLYLTGTYGFFNSIRYALFQVMSMATTAGVSLAGHGTWPAFSLAILGCIMLVGGCSFSTCGGIKVSRMQVMLKLVIRGYQKRLHPRSVVAVKLGDDVISAHKVSFITIFVLLYVIVALFGALLLSLQDLDLLTTMSSSLAMLSNIGIGMGQVSDGDFSVYGSAMRPVLCFLMLVGRLELFTFIVLFMPSFWNPNKYKN